MGLEAIAGRVSRRIASILGGSVTYTKTGGSAVVISGVFTREPVRYETEDGSALIYQARVDFAAEDLPTGFAVGDAVGDGAVNYVVAHVETDGRLGGVTMFLRLA